MRRCSSAAAWAYRPPFEPHNLPNRAAVFACPLFKGVTIKTCQCVNLASARQFFFFLIFYLPTRSCRDVVFEVPENLFS